MPRLGEAPVTQPAPDPHYDEWGFYPFERSLTASQELLDQSVSIDADSDFYWVALVGEQTSTAYELRFKLPSGRYSSSSRLRSTMLVGTAQLPGIVSPFVRCPANSRIGIDIKDLSGSTNAVYLGLKGFRRFRTRG